MKKLEIKAARTRLGLSQKDVAQQIGMSPGSYQKRESGVVDFAPKEMVALANVLGLNINQVNDFLFDGELPSGG